MIKKGGKYKLTERFQQEALSGTLVPVERGGALVHVPEALVDWPARFMQFIMNAQIPPRIEDTKGGSYPGNKFSEDACKVYKALITSGMVNEEMLTMSTMLYYKSSTRYKKAIGNYITQGDWRTDYQTLVEESKKGPDAINQLLKQETKDEHISGYKLG